MMTERRLKKYERQFQEMSYSRKQIQQEIFSSNRNRLEHLLLCYYLNTDDSIKHWQGEIYADIKDIANKRWSANKKYLSKDEYFNYLWHKVFVEYQQYYIVDGAIEDLIFDLYKIPSDWKEKKVRFTQALHDFYLYISTLLSEGKINKQAVYSLIDNFVKE